MGNIEKELKAKIKEKKQKEKMDKSMNKQILNKNELKEIQKKNKKVSGKLHITNDSGNIIDMHDVSKIFISGKVKTDILKNVSFSIKKGSLVAIIGASGSGKTTLLNIMSGLDRATSGDVITSGTNLSTLSNSSLTTFRRNHIGFIFQSYNLLTTLNVEDNVEMGRTLQMDGNKRLNTMDVLNDMGLSKHAKFSISELSGGQKQRVSISRALAKNPTIIFADEPTGALDSKTKNKVLKTFKDINKKYKTTIIIVTHDPNVTKFADYIIEVKDGEITNK